MAHEKLIEQLFTVGEELPQALHDAILAEGAPIAPALRALLDDEELLAEDARGGGWAPIHAMQLLAELRDEESVPLLVAILADSDPEEEAWTAALDALATLDGAVLEPCLQVYAESDDDPDLQRSVVAVLCELSVKDERVFAILAERFVRCDNDLLMATTALAQYGDPRALPLLTEMLDAADSNEELSLDIEELDEIAAAIAGFGGTLTPAQEALLADARKQGQSRSLKARTPVRAVARPGRNEPCWCGSGNKYKRCHLDDDAKHGGPAK